MPIRYRIFPAINIVFAEITGEIDCDDVLDYFRDVRNDPDYRLGLDRIVDSQHVKKIDISYAQLRNILTNESDVLKLSPRRVTTVHVIDENVWFGMARMYQQLVELADEQNVHIAKTIQQALNLLGHGADALAEISEFRDSPTR